MKKLFIMSLLLLAVWAFLFADIHSSSGGGQWSNPSSWLEGTVPGSDDNVIITSTIAATDGAVCNDLTITSTGTLQGIFGSSVTLTVNGNLFNSGTVRRLGINPLNIKVYGNIVNTNSFTITNLLLDGSSDQYLSNSGTFAPTNITAEDASGSVILESNLSLTDTVFNLNQSHLVLDSSAGTFNLTMTGGYLTNVYLDGGNGATLAMNSNCYLQNATVSEIVFADMVILSTNVTFDRLINQGTMRNKTGSALAITINQRLENHGTISNSPSQEALTVNLAGDFYDYGTVSNNTINFTPNPEHIIYQDASASAIQCAYCNFSADPTNSAKAISNLNFSNCQINLNNCILKLFDAGQSYTLHLDGGYLQYAVLEGGTNAYLYMENNAYLSTVEMDNFTWQGIVQISGSIHVNNLINYSICRNLSSSKRSGVANILYIHQRVDNYGTFTDNPQSSYLNIYLYGNLYDYGTISNRHLYLFSEVQHIFYQDTSAQPIQCQSVSFDSYQVGSIQAVSNLNFSNCQINLNGCTLYLFEPAQSYSLHLSEGYLTDGIVQGGTAGILYLENDAYLSFLTMDNVIWQGIVNVGVEVVVNNLTNQSQLRNISSDDIELNITQNLVNHGNISNNPQGGSLYINLGGDLANDGNISNATFSLTGTQDQYVNSTNSITVGSFALYSDIGAALWYKDDTLFSPTLLSYIEVNPNENCVWQPRTDSQSGRHIFLGNPNIGLSAPAGLSFSNLNGELTIRWNQVTNASFYNLYTASSPEGPYTKLPDHIIDNDLSDGIVEITVEATENIQFYRITAEN